MQISTVDFLTRKISIAAITGYQKHISPHKGFACAHRVLYGGQSCSQYIKQAIAQSGFRVGWIKSRDRFQACKQANKILCSRNSSVGASPQKPRRRHNCDDSCYADCADISCNCAEGFAELADWDCSLIDCGIADCGFMTCSGVLVKFNQKI
ncbi:MAG: membrane protein insertion efficiency factor YidD [Calothrix sp. MO_192.B10]|nr:membrane protein insertion efficiency factor YidD [Calothrix sp. MO_192.B10]